MNPEQLAEYLRHVANGIDLSAKPSISKLKADLKYAIVATDKSIALEIRDAIVQQIISILPAEFEGNLFDTNPEGKGFRAGYVSFGLDPISWDSIGIIGGILFKGTYDPKEFKSESPQSSGYPTKPFKHSKGGGIFDVEIEAGYNNKKVDGSYQKERFLSSFVISVDDQEKITEIEVVDPQSVKSGIQDLIKDILSNPPEAAQSASLKRKNLPPTASPKTLQRWLNQQERGEVFLSELTALSRSISDRLERPFGQVLEEMKMYFRRSGFPIDEKR